MGFLAILGSEASVLLLTLAAVQCSISITCVQAYRKDPSLGSVQAGALGCLTLAGLAAALSPTSVGEYCSAYPMPHRGPASSPGLCSGPGDDELPLLPGSGWCLHQTLL